MVMLEQAQNYHSLRLVFVCVLLCLIRYSSEYCEFKCSESPRYYYHGYYYYNYTCDVSCYKENLNVKFNQTYTPPSRDYYYKQNVNYIGISINASDTTQLQSETFIKYPGVQILKIFNTEIRALLPGAFTGLINVTELYLNNNHLNIIKSGVFNSMAKLKTLDLSFNDITHVDDHAFFNLHELQMITLKQNKITVVYPTLFSWSRRLTRIDLSHNMIPSIEAETIDLPELQVLNLENNLLKNVTSMCTHLSKGMEYLDLSNNQIEDLEGCSKQINIKSLKLSSNNLTNIDFLNGNFNYLEVFVISNNEIKEIGHVLTHLKQLQILNLSVNKISVLPIGCFSNLTKLQHLNLSHNVIDELQYGVFQDLNNVVNLDLSHNHLRSLHEQCFHVMKSLKYLKIDDNNIVNIDVHELTSGLSLLQVSLENNKWKCPTLRNIVKNFEKLDVAITVSSERKRKNIYGIFCEDGDFENNQTVPNVDKFEENFKKTSLFELIKKISDDSLVDLKKFDDSFKNTEFYNFLKKDLLNNNFSAILNRFDGAFVETLAYKTLQKKFLKSKLEEFVRQNSNDSVLDDRSENDEKTLFQKYLDEGFRNHEKNNLDYGKHIYTLLIFVVLLLTSSFLITIYGKYQKFRRNFRANINNDTSSAILMT